MEVKLVTQRNFTSTAVPAILTQLILSTDTSFIVSSQTGWPAVPFTAVIDRGTSYEEVVQVNTVVSNTVTVARGQEGTTAVGHNLSATFEHDASARDFNDANIHIYDTVIGTPVYHLGSHNITAANITAGTITGTELSSTLTLTGSLSAVTLAATGLTGSTASTRYVGGVASTAPASGTHLLGDWVVSQTGSIYVCTVAGTPGTWSAATGSPATNVTSETTYAIASAVGTSLNFARQDHTHGTPSTPVTSLTTNTGLSTNASATGAVTITNTGVLSVASRTGAVTLTAADIAAGTFPAGQFVFQSTVQGTNFVPTGLTGATTAVRIVGGTTTTAPTTGTFSTGDMVIAQGGSIFVCTAGGTPGTWFNSASGSGVTGLATTVTSETAFSISSVVGTGTLAARNDHTHGSPTTPVTTLAVTNNASVNASTGAVTITNSLTPVFTSATIPVLTNSTIGSTDGTYFAWDTGTARMGFSKKSTVGPKIGYANIAFVVTEYVGQTDITPTNAQTDRFTIATGGNATFANNLTISGTTNSVGNLSENGNRVYSSGNAPPYPVTSVSSRTGAVVVGPADIATGTFPGVYTVTGALTGSSTIQATNFVATGLTGATAASRYVGATATVAPTTGTFALGDYVISQTGSVFVCTTAGSPGTWSNAASGSGVTGLASSVASETSFGLSSAVGSSSLVAHGDHTHGSPTTPVTTLAGTANQIAASASTGAVILTLPSAITAPGTLNTTGNLSENGNRVYSAGNAPPYPVTSVATRTGAVTLTATDIAAGAFPASSSYTIQGNLTLTQTTTTPGSLFLAGGFTGSSGYVGFYANSGNRQGYIGDSNTSASADTGTLNYVAGSHVFTGTLNTTGNLSENGARVYSANNPPAVKGYATRTYARASFR